MLQVSGLSKSYHNVSLFEDVTFSVGRGEIVGLVGRNGSGKSTLVKIIAGFEDHDKGEFTTPKGYKLGYLDQHIHFTKDTLIEECCQELAEDEQYDHYKAEKLLFGLGFMEGDLHQPPSVFSGGFQLRINLVKTLLRDPDLLLLDEPTNYLDILSLRWLRRFLKAFRGEVIIITHDRQFMDTVTTHTMGIHRGRLTKTRGPTDKYYAQILMDEEVHERTRQKQKNKVKELQNFVDRFGAKASKASQAKSKVRQIEKMNVLSEIAPEYKLGFRFNYKATHAKTVMEVEELAFSYTGVADDNLFEGLSFQIRPGDRLAVIGKNGKGKTTLLNILAGTLKPTVGSVNLSPATAVGYYQQTHRKELNPQNTVVEEIAKAGPALHTSRVRAICGAMLFSGDLAEKKISVLSGGEQSRVLLGKILARPANLLLLDEPSNHLDMDSIQVMTQEVSNFKGGVVIVTHDEEILGRLANKLVIFHEDRAVFFDGTYQDFLDTTGWEEEASHGRAGGAADAAASKYKNDKPPKSPSKGRRSDPAKEEKRKLKALTREHEDMEKEIKALEADLEDKNNEAQKLVREGGKGAKIRELYKTIGGVQSKIDAKYLEMEELFERIDSLKTTV
ncbi:MAG: ABC-F family ATP-binding cassette domain-containing protein [Thermodesulfobacteriota bacterium]